ncbi:MAG TPA: metalloregulator ArsR/SmtB family transcription factor [Treponemataceae bacterium]|jgi:ArsR family transcriptional regulator, lead/cadmium/zinc/bismuth-responsive transcriptional repressor|nr:metalloregulator ArsR/SmtB family transcription factor [Treponemataceae bacterium]
MLSNTETSIDKSDADQTILFDLAEFFKVFADSTRIQLLYVLLKGELCVNDLSQELKMSQSAVSHQLRLLKNARLVRFRREGKTLLYSLCDNHIQSILDQGMEHISE